ncbi:MAG: leucyl aminopeptidase [Nitriliruptorales bacterium]|nr:leucyl aminopeptidase [Nitriliruptorales bacterium]
MSDIAFAEQTPADVQADVVAVFATKGENRTSVPGADAVAVGERLEIDISAVLSGVRFDGDLAAVARIPTQGKIAASLVLVVGLGPAEKLTLETLRRGAGAAARNATKDATLAVVVPGDLPSEAPPADRAQTVTEGAGLGSYAFTTYRSKPTELPSLTAVKIVAGNGLSADDIRGGVDRGATVVRATRLARDLVNTPPADKRPPVLAEKAVAVGEAAGLRVRVLDEQALEDGGFGGILGVGRGSSAPPRLVELTYEPDGAGSHVVLVGKGITFDSGGLSLKPPNAMSTMKMDMAGAATVLGAMSVLGDLGVTVKVTGLLALAENMPSGHATRVSDVLTHRGGKTVEVMNTDAEGRLVLGDALAYATEAQPDAIIDLATLTGAQIVALGNRIAGVMGNNDDLIEEIKSAAAAAGEQVWQLPLPDEYEDHLRSEVADFKNIGKPMQAGTIIGGLYLQKFVGEVPWAHVDIAGPAFTEEGDSWYTPKGGTGMGVRTLLALLTARSGG